MTGPKVTIGFDYEYGNLHIITDSEQSFDIRGESADRMAETLGISEEGDGTLNMPEGDWDRYARKSFR